nr:pre-mRNA-processing protein 40A-like isoform X1 [Tanacetum cinerariifolium]
MFIPTKVDATTNGKEYKSFDGRKYYYNMITEQSKWKIPDDLKVFNTTNRKKVGTEAHVKVEKSGCVSQPDWPAVICGVC